jgi:hypothetical protein
VAREDIHDQPTPALGQRDGDEPAIVKRPLLTDEEAPREVGHDARSTGAPG